MACANGEVNITKLFRAPEPPPVVRSRIIRPKYLTGTHTMLDVQKLLDNPPHHVPKIRTGQPPPAPKSTKFGHKERHGDQDKQMSYSAGSQFTSEEFIGPDGNQTFNPERHVHVIHHEQPDNERDHNNWVELILTDRTVDGNHNAQHPIKIQLLGDPSGQEVNNAAGALLAIMNSRPPGKNKVTW